MTGTRRLWRDEQDTVADPSVAQGRRCADRGRSWSSSHRGTEYRLIMTVIVGLCAAGAGGSVIPGLDAAVGAVLVAAALGAVAVVITRRELRIRGRIADTFGARPVPRPASGATEQRVGPGVVIPVPPASTAQAHPLQRVLAHVPLAPPAATRARPSTPSRRC